MNAILILSTASSHDEASRIAEVLVTEQLAACVQLSPIESWYCWEGKLHREPETRLQVKTMAHLADRTVERIRTLHSYDVPEIVVIPITGGSAAYLDWIAGSVGTEP